MTVLAENKDHLVEWDAGMWMLVSKATGAAKCLVISKKHCTVPKGYSCDRYIKSVKRIMAQQSWVPMYKRNAYK